MAVELELIDESEAWKIFDETAHRLLQISADTFVEQWERGVYGGPEENTKAMQVAMLRPSGR